MKINKLLLALALSSWPLQAMEDDYEKALNAHADANIEAAYIHIRNALQNDPKRLPAKLLYAEILLEKNMLLEAEDQLLSARALGADDNLLVELLGQVLMRLGQYERVFSEFDDGKLAASGQRQYALLKASAYLGLRQEQQALSLYQSLSQQYPNDKEVLLGLASVHIALFELQQAQSIISQLTSESPKDTAPMRYQGTLHYLRGQYSDALNVFETANTIEPENVLTLRGLVNVLIAQENYTQAKVYVDQLVALEPYDPQARLLSSIVLEGLQQTEQANQLLKQINDELSSLEQTFILSKPQLMLIDSMASYNLNNWEQARVKLSRYVSNAGRHIDVRAVVLLADVYQKLGKPSDALQILEAHSEKLLQNKDFALLLVSLYVRYNQKIDAEQLLERLQGLYRDDQDILIYSAHLLSQKRQVASALELLNKAQDKQSRHFQHTLAVLYLKDGDSTKAINILEQLVTKHPEDVGYQLLLVQALKLGGQLRTAFNKIEALHNEYALNNDVTAEYAKFLYVRGQKEAAHGLFQQLFLNNEDNHNYGLYLAEIEYSMGRFESAISRLKNISNEPLFEHKALSKLATLFAQIEQHNNSLEIANRLLRLDRLDQGAMYIKAQAHINMNQNDLAKGQINRLATLWSQQPENLIKLAKMQVRIKDVDGATMSFKRARALASEQPKVLEEKIKFELFTQQLNEAKRSIAELEKMPNHDRSLLLTLKGDLAVAQQEFEQGFKHYANALEIKPKQAAAFMKLSSLGKSKRFSENYIELAEAVVKTTSNPLYRNTLAEHLMLYQQYDRAKFHYQTLLTSKIPRQTAGFAFNNLAMIGIYQQDYPSAIKAAEQALTLINDVPAIFDTAGWAHTLNRNYDRGLYYLRQAFAMNAQSTEILYHLAYTLTQMGRIEEARRYLQRLSAFDDYPEKADVEQLRSSIQ